MGVDATLYIVADYSPENPERAAYAEAMLDLAQDYDLWDRLNDLTPLGHRRLIQVMRGSWVSRSDGSGRDDDRESGYLFGDSYAPDAGFKVYRVADLEPIAKDWPHTNGRILRFVVETYPVHTFIIVWH
jgi:hypothetical protein